MGTTEQTADTPLSTEVPPTEQGLWCVAANVVGAQSAGLDQPGPGGGTKHFKPGAKVYAIDCVAGDKNQLVAIGHHRKSRQFVKAGISLASVEQLRLEEVSIPNVTALARKHMTSDGTTVTHERAEALLRSLIAQQAGNPPR